MPEGHPWEQEDHVTIRDLAGVPFVTFDGTYVVHRQLLGRFRAEDLHPTIACTGASVRYLCEMARLSGHALVLPAPIIRSCTEAKMKILPFEPVFPWELSLVFRKNDFLSNAARALTAHIQGCFLKEKL